MPEPFERLPLQPAGKYSPGSLLTPFPPPYEKKRRLPIWRTAGRSIVEASRQAWTDLRAARWASVGLWSLYVVFTVLSAGALGALLGSAVRYQGAFASDTGCEPDGSFSVYPDRFDWWAPAGFFEMTVSFGALKFVEVKVLDIVWQVVGSIPPRVLFFPAGARPCPARHVPPHLGRSFLRI